MENNIRSVFLHERLEACRFARAFYRSARVIRELLPRGIGEVRDQLYRAASSVSLAIAEGANASQPKIKSLHFTRALASAGECAAALDQIEDVWAAPAALVAMARDEPGSWVKCSGRGGDDYAHQKALVGAIEMYNLDKNTRRGRLDASFFDALKSGGYLQAIPSDPGAGPGTSSHYRFDLTGPGSGMSVPSTARSIDAPGLNGAGAPGLLHYHGATEGTSPGKPSWHAT